MNAMQPNTGFGHETRRRLYVERVGHVQPT